ncbi:hypothetical protein CLV98_12331 [Dyadobacter jejuensis]|uniref:DUF4134 domain-containing protein n=1 Tax=Dyadobacter jejuensis TaxID=1082580 RepID=A0A316ATD8_9BACT|nr:hypothetical protein [Dyadobacter jejuensis]PWJ53417.1 hypothetical protein CLV98_12331 [Dyadobacter jejuensis]
MDQLYVIVRETATYGVGIAAIASGYRIYVKWNRGEPVISLILNWILSLIIAGVLFNMIYVIVLNGTFMSLEPLDQAIQMGKEMHSAAIVIGVAFAILAIIHIYYRYTSGDDVTELVYRWIASLFFLFTFGLIIELLI